VIRISGIAPESIVDGPGIRYTVFTQGCPHRCEGCHNPETHDPSGGYDITAGEILQNIRKNPLLDGVTLSGGEPFMQPKQLLPLVRKVKEEGLSVIVYSGYTFEELMRNADAVALLQYADILIDGRFILADRSLELLFRGSKNQRIIDVPKSLSEGKAVLADLR